MNTLRHLHKEYPGIKVYEIVPCPCPECRVKEKEEVHYFELENLFHRLSKGRQKIECDKSLEEVDLLEMLGDMLVFQHLKVGEQVVLEDAYKRREPRTVKIFLASSEELKAERERIEIEINRMNKDLQRESIFLELLNWEGGRVAETSSRSQDNYNRGVEACDIFVLLFYSKVGRYTLEEYEIAKKRYAENQKPAIWIFQKDIDLPKDQTREDAESRFDFLEKLEQAEQFPTCFKNEDGLWLELQKKLRAWMKEERQGFVLT
ncbi:MAG: DUF4062 domain-containing protein [Saprospiraceae bacterium]|nr:DUF4062 domain-containing protein [Saprospiraceae bacterium]MDW8485064.1 DUF4062 domain-containing protein [Saprospiraceae bacterium]